MTAKWQGRTCCQAANAVDPGLSDPDKATQPQSWTWPSVAVPGDLLPAKPLEALGQIVSVHLFVVLSLGLSARGQHQCSSDSGSRVGNLQASCRNWMPQTLSLSWEEFYDELQFAYTFFRKGLVA